jgi:hypothetical protein
MCDAPRLLPVMETNNAPTLRNDVGPRMKEVPRSLLERGQLCRLVARNGHLLMTNAPSARTLRKELFVSPSVGKTMARSLSST